MVTFDVDKARRASGEPPESWVAFDQASRRFEETVAQAPDSVELPLREI